MLVGWGLVSDESPKQGQSSVMFWLFNEFQWVAMDQIALIFQRMDVTWCNQYLHKTLRGIAINWKFGNPLFKNYIYIYHIYIYTSIYQIRKNMSGRPPFPNNPVVWWPTDPTGSTFSLCIPIFRHSMAWWCRPSNCRWELHLWRLFWWRSIDVNVKYQLGACPDIYIYMYIIYILQKQQNSKFHQ